MAATASAIATSLSEYQDADIAQAVQLLLSLRPSLRDPLADILIQEAEARYVGVITAFYPQKRYGFIQSDAVKELYGIDTFLSDIEIGSFAAGDTVSFSVVQNAKGQPQARLLQPAGSIALAPESAPPPQRPSIQPIKQAPIGAPIGAPIRQSSPIVLPRQVPPLYPQNEEAERFEGVINAYYPEKKYGFIVSEGVKQQYGMDCFLSSMEIGSLSTGTAVSFRVALNSKGCPQARDVQPAEPSIGAYAAPPPQSKKRKLEVPTMEPAQGDAGTRYIGTIKSFFADRKFGFIQSDDATRDYGIDTFVSDKEIRHFTNGDVVSFSVVLNKDLKPQARDLEEAFLDFA